MRKMNANYAYKTVNKLHTQIADFNRLLNPQFIECNLI